MSQTPREILLSRHRDEKPKLDAVRREAVASIAGASAAALEADAENGIAGMSFGSVARLLWSQLVAPCRRVWGGLAVAWAVILVLNVVTNGEKPAPFADAQMSMEESVIAMRAQRQLLAELAGEAKPSRSEGEPAAFRPRGEARRKMFNV